jgi:hypothetical protein
VTVHGELVGTLRRLDASTEHGEVRAGAPPDSNWVRVGELVADPVDVAAWFARLRAGNAHPPDVAASFLAGWLSDILLHAPATALQTERRVWAIDPGQTWVHAHPEGWFDGLAVGDAVLRVLPDDVAASDQSAIGRDRVEVVADVAALRRHLASDVVAVLAPLFGALRSLAPFGRRGMWGSAADALAGGAVWTAFRAGADTAGAFEDAVALADDMVAAGGGPLNHPSALPIECRHGTITVAVRGTCCLWYKVPQDATGHERYCTSCPLRDDDSQRAMFMRWLDEQPAPGGRAR